MTGDIERRYAVRVLARGVVIDRGPYARTVLLGVLRRCLANFSAQNLEAAEYGMSTLDVGEAWDIAHGEQHITITREVD